MVTLQGLTEAVMNERQPSDWHYINEGGYRSVWGDPSGRYVAKVPRVFPNFQPSDLEICYEHSANEYANSKCKVPEGYRLPTTSLFYFSVPKISERVPVVLQERVYGENLLEQHAHSLGYESAQQFWDEFKDDWSCYDKLSLQYSSPLFNMGFFDAHLGNIILEPDGTAVLVDIGA